MCVEYRRGTCVYEVVCTACYWGPDGSRRRVCVSVRVYTNGSYTHYICSLAALRQANFRRFSRAARAGKF